MKNDVASAAGVRGIVAADFNRDGWPDLAEAGVGTNTVSVLLNAEGDHLAFARAVPVGAGPFDLTTGDFNRDGIADLAVANADGNSISILIGRGDGRFTRSDISTAPYRSPRGITAADVNGDGKLDVVYTGYQSNLLQVLLGTGTGGFSKGWSLVGQASQPQGLEPADFNRDGHLDIAVAYDSDGGQVIWYGSDGTTFAPGPIPGEGGLNVLAVADLNGDGWTDVAAAATNRGRVAVYLGTPSGLVYKRSYPVDSDPRGIVVADVNSDGVPDVITASRTTSTVDILLGDPAQRGAFLPRLVTAAGRGSRAVTTADFNADGRLDLATGNQYAAAASILTNDTAFVRTGYSFGERILTATSVAARSGLDAADFNRDGQLDVVTNSGWMFSADGVMVLITNGPTVVLPVPGGMRLGGFLTADLDADGNPDIVVYARERYGVEEPSAGFVVYRGDGRGGFSTLSMVPVSTVISNCAPGDLDRDGRLDLACVGRDPAAAATVLRVLRGNGNGSFRDGARVVLRGSTEGADPEDVRVADVNRDGALDVTVLNAHGAGDFLEVWLGDGAGRLADGGRIEIMMDLSFRGHPESFRIEDLNRDGHADIILYRGEGQLGVGFGTASGFHGVVEIWRDFEVRYPGPPSIGVADVNMDGRLDIITPLGWALHGRGDGTFEPAERFAFLGQSVMVADFTGDGLPDVLHTDLIDDSDDPPPPLFNGIRVLVNQRNAVNHLPVVSAIDRRFDYQDYHPPTGGQCPWVRADAVDPDQHAVTFEWRDEHGALVSQLGTAYLCDLAVGAYRFEVTVRDGRGGDLTRPVVLTIVPGKEIVLYAGADPDLFNSTVVTTGNWSWNADSTAAGGFRAHDRNLGAAKVSVPAATAANTIALAFVPDPTLTYKLWIRLKADQNNWANDSVWVQFSNATDLAGQPVYRIGTTSGLAVSLEECTNCGVAGWGWQDDGWGAVDTPGVLLRFPGAGQQLIQIQTREDGVSIDQIVLSAERYLRARPGAAKNDRTILPRTYPVRDQ